MREVSFCRPSHRAPLRRFGLAPGTGARTRCRCNGGASGSEVRPMTQHQPTTSDLSPARLGVVVHGHGEVVFTFGHLAVEDDVLDVDVTKSIEAFGNATKKRGDISLSSPIRVRP